MRAKNCRASDDKLKLSEANEWEIWIETTEKEKEFKAVKERKEEENKNKTKQMYKKFEE